MKLSVLVLFLLTHFGLNAVSQEITGAQLTQLLGFYKSIDSLQVGFHQEKKLKDMKSPLKSEGTLKVQRPDQVQWEIVKPSRVLVTLSPSLISLESGEGDSKTVQSFKRGDLAQGKESRALEGLVSWLQVDAIALSKEYRVMKTGEREYQFEPRAIETSPFEKLQMKLSLKKHIEKLLLFEKSGDLLEISFGSPKVTFKK